MGVEYRKQKTSFCVSDGQNIYTGNNVFTETERLATDYGVGGLPISAVIKEQKKVAITVTVMPPQCPTCVRPEAVPRTLRPLHLPHSTHAEKRR